MKKQENTVLELAKAIASRYSPQKIMLFGSYAWGKPTRHSDIDFFIVKNTRKKLVQRFVEVLKILYGAHSMPVEPLVLTPKELEKRVAIGDPFILRILKEGKTLWQAGK